MAFSKGDVVQLKSGSPAMTVRSLGEGGDPMVYCVWFDGSKQINGSFPPETLELAPDPMVA